MAGRPTSPAKIVNPAAVMTLAMIQSERPLVFTRSRRRDKSGARGDTVVCAQAFTAQLFHMRKVQSSDACDELCAKCGWQEMEM